MSDNSKLYWKVDDLREELQSALQRALDAEARIVELEALVKRYEDQEMGVAVNCSKHEQSAVAHERATIVADLRAMRADAGPAAFQWLADRYERGDHLKGKS